MLQVNCPNEQKCRDILDNVKLVVKNGLGSTYNISNTTIKGEKCVEFLQG